MKYNVTAKVAVLTSIDVEATSEEEAVAKAKDIHQNSMSVLDWSVDEIVDLRLEAKSKTPPMYKTNILLWSSWDPNVAALEEPLVKLFSHNCGEKAIYNMHAVTDRVQNALSDPKWDPALEAYIDD